MADNVDATPQVEADRRLINFETYDDYLNSLITCYDHYYFQSQTIARKIAELGYRSSGETLTQDQFEKRLAAVKDYLYPTFQPYVLASEFVPSDNIFLRELSLRERSNRLGILSSIIYIREFTDSGCEISGYIDFSERLTMEDWKPIFRGVKKVRPRPTDLGYYDWKREKTTCNDSKNFKVVVHPKKGLLFQNRFDRKLICADPSHAPGSNTSRIRIPAVDYEHVIIYDHVVMQRI